MNKTKIEWVKNPDGTQGYTWNPITGCLNGCEYCYARKLANGRLRSRYLANLEIAIQPETTGNPYRAPFYPRFWEERLAELEDLNLVLAERREFGKPRGIFTCDMSDLFGKGIPEEWTEAVLNEIANNNNFDRFYLLTKQPQNLIKWNPFPDNCWVGVTHTGRDFGYTSYWLGKIEANIRFVSFEPLLEQVNWLWNLSHVDWVIIGAQTKPYKPPKIEWVQEIVEACDKARIPVFCKDNLESLLHQLPQSCIAWTGWGEQTRRELRQELPAPYKE